MEIKKIIGHIRDRDYMSGIEREQSRVKVTNEIFTPTTRAITDIYKLPSILFSDPTKKFQDQCCGDGQFLGEVLIRKVENGSTFEQALSTIYGVDLMIDNVDLCRERLLCGQEQFRQIVEQNIQCRDALKFKYNFEPLGPARRKNEDRARRVRERIKAKEEKRKLAEEKLAKEEARKKKDEKIFAKNFEVLELPVTFE